MTADRTPDTEPREHFEGHDGRECGEHRTTGHRAWCFDCSEWCYPTIPCRGCELPKLRAALTAREEPTMPEPADRPPSGLRDQIAEALTAKFIARHGSADEIIRSAHRDHADAVLPVVEAETAALRQRAEEAEAKVAALMDPHGAQQIERIQAERDALPDDERTRLDAADAPMLRIQLAGAARRIAETKAELDRTATAAARKIWVKAGFDTILHWKERAETAERQLQQALDQIATERRGRLAAEAAARRVRPALDSARRSLVTSSRDQGEARDTAWLYGIFVGWDPEEPGETDGAMAELAAQHRWRPEDVARLREYRNAIAALDAEQPKETP